MTINLFECIFAFVIGTIFGSFYNVVGYRVPNKMSVVFPNSHCPNCKHKLKFYDLVPIVSYAFLKGRCRYCKMKISFIYPFFEFLSGLLFMLSFMVYGLSFKTIITITFISILLIISISDIRYFIIPDNVLIIGSVLIILEYIISSFLFKTSFINTVFIPILNGLGMMALMYLIKVLGDFLFKKESLGGGDIKLMFFVALVLSFNMSVVSIFLASFIALPVAIISLIKNNDNIVPFGPYISLASVIIILTKLDINTIMNFFVK